MPQKKRRSEPKVFRCTGFGDCDMVFTRSEHLARHARKHTGEKPFQCIVPNCNRMFSRFDNMMQHTHTHNRNKKKSMDGILSPKDNPNLTYTEPQRFYTDHVSYDNTTYNTYYQPLRLPSPSPEPVKYQTTSSPWNQMYYTPITSPPLHPMASIPTPISSCCSESSYQPRQQTPDTLHPPQITETNDPLPSLPKSLKKRRLSYMELFSPIKKLASSSESSSDDDDDLDDDEITRHSKNGIDITKDEFEALQGFSKFCAEPVVLKDQLPPLRPSAFSSYVPAHAFRQHISIAPESFQRSSN